MADGFDEAAQLRAFQKRVGDLLRPLAALTRLKAREPALVGRLEDALRLLPDAALAAAAIDEVRQRGQALLRDVRHAREADLRLAETGLLKDLRASGHAPRELDTGWRIGPLEWQFDKAQARVRACFNREVLVDWTPFASREGFDKLIKEAESRLKSSDIGDAVRRQVLWAAYQEARKSARSNLVTLKDFYKQVRIQVVKAELESGRVDRKLESADFPRWRFLYNLDLYRKESGDVPIEFRLGFETGSQADHTRGLSMVLNGLDAADTYKTYCYVVTVSGAGH